MVQTQIIAGASLGGVGLLILVIVAVLVVWYKIKNKCLNGKEQQIEMMPLGRTPIASTPFSPSVSHTMFTPQTTEAPDEDEMDVLTILVSMK